MNLKYGQFYYYPKNRTVTYWGGTIREPGKALLMMIVFTSIGHERALWLWKLN